jgi:general secretion pathway protein H
VVKQNGQGFTLIEVMIVVVIIAILMGAVAMSIPRDINDQIKEHANRFQALLSLFQDEAILQSRELALGFSESGYTFYQLEENKWTVNNKAPFKSRVLPSNLFSSLYLEGISVTLEDQTDAKPQVFILSSGEVTPFVYELQFSGHDRRVKIKVNAIGGIEQEFLER